MKHQAPATTARLMHFSALWLARVQPPNANCSYDFVWSILIYFVFTASKGCVLVALRQCSGLTTVPGPAIARICIR